MAATGTSEAAGAAENVDSSSDQMPETFLKTFTENSAAIENGFDLLVMVYHGLMLESGFSNGSKVQHPTQVHSRPIVAKLY